METPPSDLPDAPEVSSGPAAPPSREDPEVVAFLRGDLLPILGHRVARGVLEAVRRAVREERLTALEQLTGRQRHELLLAIEQVVETGRRPSPAVLVRLTSVVSATPAAPELVGVSAARPAR